MARCGCGAGGVSIANGPNTVVTGSGTQANPYVIAAHTDCAEARACLSGTSGVNYNAATGVISADVSATVGNALTLDGDGLFVPASTVTVSTGPGVVGDGTIGNPVKADVFAWNFPTTADANGSRVYVDSTGKLRSEPGYHSYYFQNSVTRLYGPPLSVPATPNSAVDVPYNFMVTNPDPVRSVRVVVLREYDAWLTIQPGGQAASGFDNIETYRMVNSGGSVMPDIHSAAVRGGVEPALLAPGASTTLTMQPNLGSGIGGSECYLITMSFRVLMLPV